MNSNSNLPTILNDQEAADLLRVSKRSLMEMARRKEIPAKKIGREWRFSRAALLSFLEDSNHSKELDKQETKYFVTDEGKGDTLSSLQVYEVNKASFLPVEEAFIFFDDEDSRARGFSLYGGSTSPTYPTLVLRNGQGGEMWLSGCSCGYGGEGPSGTQQILRSAGFSANLVDLVTTHKLLHLRRDSKQPAEAKPAH